jgi:histidinol-phosphate aminotransferase
VPFVPPEAFERRRGKPFRARLGANESGFGPSPAVLAAIRAAAADIWMYGDPENHDLRAAIAHHHGVSPENVVVGEGIDGLLGLAARLLLAPGAVAVMTGGAYPTFGFHVAACGGTLVKVPYRQDREDLDGLLEAARHHRPAALFVSNPNSPMGTWWTAPEIERFISALPPGVMLLLDEAYADTAPEGVLPPLTLNNLQVLRFRTFSKAYGLAGIRVGYVLGETSVIGEFNKVRNHYGVGRIAQAAAFAAIADQAYLRQAVANISSAKARLANIARANGLEPLPSGTNFVTIDCGRDGAFADAVMQALLDRDVFLRKPGVAPQDRCIRVSAGADPEIDVFEAELPAALSAVRAIRG